MFKRALLYISILLCTNAFAYGNSLLDQKAEEVTEELANELMYAYLSAGNNCRGYIGTALNYLNEAGRLDEIVEEKISAGIKYPPELDAIRTAMNATVDQLQQATDHKCEPTQNIARSIKLLKFGKQIFELEYR